MREALKAICLLLAVIAGVAYCAKPQAAGGAMFSAESCASLATVVEQTADARDAGIGEALYTAFMRLRMARGGNETVVVRAVLSEVRRVYAGALAAAKLKTDAYTRCMTGMIGGAET